MAITDSDNAPEAIHLDVRPLLAAGENPLGVVLDHAAEVPPGGLLIVEAPFDPVPLRSLLSDEGFVAQARMVGPGHWTVRFRRSAES
ncbi:DUF2249 domain-containing protein [Azospirillum canadense]|uniref:DUF2249 domain-containing protein n=1 Tax=Azospirillum canadense TaxID=403962 RepID=UPI0022263997|nr:DUF2249 domain-containing protein [Azospirillum canadense]MCW2241953.1 uncharacterized protein (DUF2249 family) [Azospirillum canadense]